MHYVRQLHGPLQPAGDRPSDHLAEAARRRHRARFREAGLTPERRADPLPTAPPFPFKRPSDRSLICSEGRFSVHVNSWQVRTKGGRASVLHLPVEASLPSAIPCLPRMWQKCGGAPPGEKLLECVIPHAYNASLRLCGQRWIHPGAWLDGVATSSLHRSRPAIA